jgi:hypothetical protein
VRIIHHDVSVDPFSLAALAVASGVRQIAVDSQPGAGASFMVTLPIASIGIVSATTDRQAP